MLRVYILNENVLLVRIDKYSEFQGYRLYGPIT